MACSLPQHMNSTDNKTTLTWKSSYYLSHLKGTKIFATILYLKKNKINYFLDQTQIKDLVPGRLGVPLSSLQNIF